MYSMRICTVKRVIMLINRIKDPYMHLVLEQILRDPKGVVVNFRDLRWDREWAIKSS